jgi:uroporphyrinogen-III synthase
MTLPGPMLSGFAILVTASRRQAEWSAAFARQGAAVTLAPTLSIVPLPAVEALLDATRELIAWPPDEVVITTAIGWRGWVEAADAHGLEPDLIAALRRTRIWARGPKVHGALHGAGLAGALVNWRAETSDELVKLLLERGVAGRRIAVQLHGSLDLDVLMALKDAGAEVQSVPVYRWGPAPDPAVVDRAIMAVCGRAVDAVVFASAPGARAFLGRATELGRLEELVASFGSAVVPATIGPVTAAALTKAGVSPVQPDRYRLGAMVRTLSEHLSAQVQRHPLPDGGSLEIRGRVALVDGREVTLPPSQLAVLRRLCERPGNVVDREQLLGALPGPGVDQHAVEVNVARLRAALGRPEVIQTVVKRGYRLAVAAIT